MVAQLLLLEVDELRAKVGTAELVTSGAAWSWEKDGENTLDSLSCPIVFVAVDPSELLAPAPTESGYAGWYRVQCQRGIVASDAPEITLLAREDLVHLRVLLNDSSPNESVLSPTAAIKRANNEHH